MSKSQRLRVSDVRGVYLLLGECRDLGLDADGWRQHLLAGLCRLTKAQVGMCGEAEVVGGPGGLRPLSLQDTGWAPGARESFAEYQRTQRALDDPFLVRFFRTRGRLVTRTREQVMADQEWYASAEYNDAFRPAGVDDGLLSAFALGRPGLTDTLALHRPPGDRRFAGRDRRLVRMLHRDLGPLVGTALAASWEPSLSGLSPRLREALDGLLAGDSVKEIAARLGLRPRTVEDYVKGLHRHFGVSSRGELLARALRRRRAGPNHEAAGSPAAS
jgi:DNA-binding CsgD family transcriptional regulator